MELIKQNFIEASEILKNFLSDDENFKFILEAGNIMVQAINSGNTIFSCGNGGSMCDAMHFAEELTGQFRDSRKALPAIAISDPSHITCTANDYGFESIFSRYIEGLSKSGDVLLAISTSGNSDNIVKAAEQAKTNKMKVIGLVGNKGGQLGKYCDIVIKTPASEYSDRVQEIHIKVIHSIIHYIEQNID